MEKLSTEDHSGGDDVVQQSEIPKKQSKAQKRRVGMTLLACLFLRKEKRMIRAVLILFSWYNSDSSVEDFYCTLCNLLSTSNYDIHLMECINS